MLKTDLINLVKDIADDGDINETLLKHDEFKGLKDLSKVTVEDIQTVLEGEVGKAYMTSHDDSVRSRAVETFKNGKMQDEIKKAVEAATNEELTPEQKEIQELKKWKEEQIKKNEEEERIKANGIKLKDKGLDDGFAKYVKEDADIDYFESIINKMVDSRVKEKLGNNAYKPPVGGQQGESWTLDKAMDYMNQHPDADINSVMAKVK